MQYKDKAPKKMILTRKQCAELPFAGQNTQQTTKPGRGN